MYARMLERVVDTRIIITSVQFLQHYIRNMTAETSSKNSSHTHLDELDESPKNSTGSSSNHLDELEPSPSSSNGPIHKQYTTPQISNKHFSDV